MVDLCATSMWTRSTCPLPMTYLALHLTVPGHWLCFNGSWPCSTGPWNMKFRDLDHNVQGHGTCVTEPCTICYLSVDTFKRSVDHELSGHEPYCIGPLSMCHRAVYHVLPGRRHVLNCCGPWTTVPWTWLYQMKVLFAIAFATFVFQPV